MNKQFGQTPSESLGGQRFNEKQRDSKRDEQFDGELVSWLSTANRQIFEDRVYELLINGFKKNLFKSCFSRLRIFSSIFQRSLKLLSRSPETCSCYVQQIFRYQEEYSFNKYGFSKKNPSPDNFLRSYTISWNSWYTFHRRQNCSRLDHALAVEAFGGSNKPAGSVKN